MASGQEKDKNSADLQSKYNKLATEYAKLRAQLPVLKKAVIDEQNTNATLSDNLQKREQSIRKLEQEVDSLTFRNKQLEKRIGVLQEELDDSNQKSRSRGKNKDSVQNSVDIVPQPACSDYELIAKIEENMKLQLKLSELEQSSNLEIDTLRSQLESLSNEETHKQLILNELTNLKSENQSLTFALQNSLDEIEAFKEQVDQMKEKIAVTGNTVVQPQISYDNVPTSSCKNNESETDAKPEGIESLLSSDDETSNFIPLDVLAKLTESERQKEYWIMEYQLLKMKYERVLKKWEDCKAVLRSIGKEDLIQASSSEVTTPVLESTTTVLGKMEVTYDSDCDLRGRSYEKEVKEYFSKRVDDLIASVQYADSRTALLYNEYKSMEALLTISSSQVQKLEEQIEKLKLSESQLTEEFDLTKNNYEVQLKQLSEHIAIMNDKFAEKQEIINELQAKLKSKAKS